MRLPNVTNTTCGLDKAEFIVTGGRESFALAEFWQCLRVGNVGSECTDKFSLGRVSRYRDAVALAKSHATIDRSGAVETASKDF